MKKIILPLVLFILASCSSKDVSMKETDTAPRLGFSKDTVFVRERDSLNLNGNGIFMVQAIPAHRQLHLQIYDSSGQVHFSYRGQVLVNQQPIVVAGEWNSLFCRVDKAGVYGIDLSLKDQLGRVSQKKLLIKAAAAQKPKAHLQWKADERDPGNRRYYFDAGGCTQPYGKIVSYHYLIGGQLIQATTDKLQYIFHTKGNYPIRFYVIDDLGQHSDTLHQTIDVL